MSTLKHIDLPDYCYEDYLLWEGDWELIGGVPFAMSPAPVKIHQQLVGYIFSEIASNNNHCPNCEILIDEDWKLDSKTILKPDVSVVCDDDNPTYIAKTPEIIFEVLSPSSARRDEGLKFEMYQEAGVIYYVLVYPDDLVARVFKNNGEKYKKVAECDTESFSFAAVSCPLKFDFSKIFQRFRK